VCLLYGFGIRNPPSAISAGDMVRGGVSNGITGEPLSEEGRGIHLCARTRRRELALARAVAAALHLASHRNDGPGEQFQAPQFPPSAAGSSAGP
jgi:hypothetical protein